MFPMYSMRNNHIFSQTCVCLQVYKYVHTGLYEQKKREGYALKYNAYSEIYQCNSFVGPRLPRNTTKIGNRTHEVEKRLLPLKQCGTWLHRTILTTIMTLSKLKCQIGVFSKLLQRCAKKQDYYTKYLVRNVIVVHIKSINSS